MLETGSLLLLSCIASPQSLYQSVSPCPHRFMEKRDVAPSGIVRTFCNKKPSRRTRVRRAAMPHGFRGNRFPRNAVFETAPFQGNSAPGRIQWLICSVCSPSRVSRKAAWRFPADLLFLPTTGQTPSRRPLRALKASSCRLRTPASTPICWPGSAPCASSRRQGPDSTAWTTRRRRNSASSYATRQHKTRSPWQSTSSAR